MNMDELRGRIDAVDDELLRCFAERMDIAGDIARYKAEHGLPVLDERREREKLYAVSEKAPEELQSYIHSFAAFSSCKTLFTVVCSYGDDLVLGTASALRSTAILQRFYRELTKAGLDVTLYATEVEK